VTHVARWRRAVGLLLATSVLAACGSAAGRGDRDTMVIAESLEPKSLNPALIEGSLSGLVGGILYSFLLTVDAHGHTVPDAATEVPTLRNGGISADGLRITYHLRHDIRWSDGVPLTARDVVFTFHALMNPRTNVPDRYGLDRIATITTPDRYTVVLHLKSRFSMMLDSFLSLPSNYPILAEHVLGSLPDLNHADVERPTIGSGPFTLAGWMHGDHITFAANPLYFRGRPKLHKLVMRFIPAAQTMIAQLRTHEIDAALQLTDPTLLAQMRSIPGTYVLSTPTDGMETLYFNLQTGLTTDLRLRQAIAMALDTETIVRRATRGAIGSGDALRGQFGDDALPRSVRYDPAAARRLLEADGWRLGSDGVRVRGDRRLSLTLVDSAQSVLAATIAIQMQQQLRDVGVDVMIHGYNEQLVKAPTAEGGPLFGNRFDLALVPIYSDAGPFAAQFFICSERAPAGFNFARICDRAVDRDFVDILNANDPIRRDRDARDIERLLADDVPQVPLLQIRTLAAMSDRVHGVAPSPLTPYVGMEKWSIAPER